MDIQVAKVETFEQSRACKKQVSSRKDGENGYWEERKKTERKPTYRRPISREERIRNRKKRKRIARWRRIKRIVGRLALFAFVMAVGVWALLKISGLVFGIFMPDVSAGKSMATKLLANDMTALRYEVDAPIVIEESEIEEKLAALVKKYPEFSEVYEHADEYPEPLLAALCNNPEMIDFVKGYPSNDGSVTGGLTKEELVAGIPHLLQWDARWGYAAYGDHNIIALAGCAPTCLSMVIVGLTGNENATPDAIACYAMQNGFYVEGTGTAWSLMTQGCRQWGIYGQELSLMESNIFSELEAGNPIICSVRAGDFTIEGHFIVLTGIEDGKIRVNDPNSISRSQKLWDYSTLEGQISNLWVFHKY